MGGTGSGFARPLELYEGQLINPDELQAQLRRQGLSGGS